MGAVYTGVVASFDDIRLKRTSTADQVAMGLADKIMSGELRPGQPLRENTIAIDLRISRNTVREAVRLLEQSGLVTYEFNRGTIVKEPSVDDLVELYRARLALEVAAVVTPATDDGIARVREAFERLTTAAGGGDAHEIVENDLAFHVALVSLLDSSRVDAFYAQLVRELEFYLMVLSLEEREHERPGDVLTEHRPIVDAIVAGDGATAARMVTEHIQVNTERVRRVLMNRAERGREAAAEG